MMRKPVLALAALALLATATASPAADPRIRYITFNNNAVVTVPAGCRRCSMTSGTAITA